jgi:dihydrolipoamide dehydrogenase
MVVREGFGTVESFEKTPDGICLTFSKDSQRERATASLVVVAIGWAADVAGLNLPVAAVKTNERGYIEVDAQLRTSTPHIYAAGDITGRWMLVPQAIQDGWIAGTNAAGGHALTADSALCPTGGFTEPEYASVGPTEARARAAHEVVVATIPFDTTTRTIIDDRTEGFCKLIVERPSRRILACHVVGERAVEIVQLASICMTNRQTVDELLRVPLSFPTYTGILLRAIYRAVEQMPVPARNDTENGAFNLTKVES